MNLTSPHASHTCHAPVDLTRTPVNTFASWPVSCNCLMTSAPPTYSPLINT
ncbi:hypothetical protein HanRHA438_Chr11g0514791 [Helianthus annuus]|nr:hypothetical protein HanRHA438_Chr11g0514791 [Helianthus annuus]